MTKTLWTDEELGAAVRAAVFSTTIAKTRTFELKMAEFPINALLTLLAHGAQRKFNDAVGGADKTAETKVEMAEAMIAEYREGVVSKRRESTAADPRTTIARKIMRGLVPSLLDATQLKTFRALEKDVQTEKLDGWIAANADAINPLVDEEIARMEAERKRKAKLDIAVAL